MRIMEQHLSTPQGRIRYLRTLAQVDFARLAKAVGYSVEDLQNWEDNGLPADNEIRRGTIIEKISHRFHCSRRWIESGEGEVPTDVIFADTLSLEAECPPCDGTGVFPGGSMTQDGKGVVCWDCQGEGRITMRYVPFVRRHVRTDIVTVGTNRIADHRGSVDYKAFLSGQMP